MNGKYYMQSWKDPDSSVEDVLAVDWGEEVFHRGRVVFERYRKIAACGFYVRSEYLPIICKHV